jgi:hypothetical protein
VVEDIEGLKTELDSLLLFERDRLLQRHIEVRLAGAIEVAALGIPGSAERLQT